MATDSTGAIYENRTLQFYGYAYGNSNVSLTATIEGNTVFSGEIPTTNMSVPTPPIDPGNEVLLFSLDSSDLFPTNWSGSRPMSITVSGGEAAFFSNIKSNYMHTTPANVQTFSAENSTINGNLLTLGTPFSGQIEIGSTVTGNGVLENTFVTSGSGSSWTVIPDQTVSSTTISGNWVLGYLPGNATSYTFCYNGNPENSEKTRDPRSSVFIDSTQQVPPLPISAAVWAWLIPSGSTISYNLNVALGNCAQS